MFLRLIFYTTCLLWTCNGANILGIFNLPSKSHHILGSALLKALAKQGHKVTMISPFPFKTPIENYTDVFLEEMLQLSEDKMQNIMKHNISIIEKFQNGVEFFQNSLELTLGNKNVQKLKSENFDLVIQSIMMSEALLGLAHHFKAPVIGLCTMSSNHPFVNRLIGNPAPTSYVPNMMFSTSSEMNFFQRLSNFLFSTVFIGLAGTFYDSIHENIYSKYFPDGPPLHDLTTNISVVLVNSHYSVESPRPYLPNVVQIGGFHIQEPKQLPPDIQGFLDDAPEGAVFFSLGSNVQISRQPKERIDAIINTLAALNLKVLFKSETKLKHLPKNIRVHKWLPQNDILAHPNVKLFISHGGLLSTTEAVYHGVPVLGIPIFGDQESNIAYAVNAGYALQIRLDDITEKTFSQAVQEILTNPRYTENVKLRSSLLREQPLNPLDHAIFWVEHVLKHRGAAHLKNSGLKLTWYQRAQIDVILFIGVVITLFTTVFYFVTRKIIRIINNMLFKMKKVKRN